MENTTLWVSFCALAIYRMRVARRIAAESAANKREGYHTALEIAKALEQLPNNSRLQRGARKRRVVRSFSAISRAG